MGVVFALGVESMRAVVCDGDAYFRPGFKDNRRMLECYMLCSRKIITVDSDFALSHDKIWKLRCFVKLENLPHLRSGN